MAATHPDAYWKAVALGIEAENRKATVYIKHDLSLGIAREAILRRVLINETPGPFEVKTGLIRVSRPGDPADGHTSKQCDLLVYNPHTDPPLYRMDDFVVVPQSAARYVVEVKSDLKDDKGFRKILAMGQSLRPCQVPLGAFAYDGVGFDTFVDYVVRHIDGDAVNLPECFAVHSRDFVAFRCRTDDDTGYRPRHYFVMNLARAEYPPAEGQTSEARAAGWATQFFLRACNRWLRLTPDYDRAVLNFFHGLRALPEAKVWISATGRVGHAPLPLEEAAPNPPRPPP
jgi:hypothetical protein